METRGAADSQPKENTMTCAKCGKKVQVPFKQRDGSKPFYCPECYQVEYKDHIVICGWNYQGNDIITALRSKDIFSKKQIAVLADYEKRPVESDKLDFLKGSPLNEEDLKRAGVDKAYSVIILTDIGGEAGEKTSNSDANALMITTLIRKSIKSDAHISVQLLSSQNEALLDGAGANTIVCLDKLGGSILAYSAEYHGILVILKELLFTPDGSEIYKYDQRIPDMYIGKNFSHVGKQLLDRGMFLAAIETKDAEEFRTVWCEKYCNKFITSSGERKVLIVNPEEDYKLGERDSLFIISEKEPVPTELYLFSWDNVPGSDSERLLKYLWDDLDISWAEKGIIHKLDDGKTKTISIFKDKKSAEIIIDEKKEKATLKISDDRTRVLKVKKENGKLNIYCDCLSSPKKRKR